MAEREVSDEAGEESIIKNGENLEPENTGVLAGLNLVMILSSLSSSDEQRLGLEEIEERESGEWNHKRKHRGPRSNFPTRRQQVGGFSRAVEKQQMSKIQTKMRDCRHCRRL